MTQKFGVDNPDITAPASYAAEITPNDSADLANETRAIYVGGTGNLVVVMKGGEEVMFQDIPAGTILQIRVTRVRAAATGSPTIPTTATKLVALW